MLTARFARRSAALALLAGAIVVAGAAATGISVGWGLAGWAPMSLIGVAGGAWAVSAHGKPGSSFMLATVTCILSRLVVALIGAVWASRSDVGAVVPYLAGLIAGFATLQFHEVAWFYRRSQGERPTSANSACHLNVAAG